MLLEYRMRTIAEELLATTEEKEVLKLHDQYSEARDFGEWIQMIGGQA